MLRSSIVLLLIVGVTAPVAVGQPVPAAPLLISRAIPAATATLAVTADVVVVGKITAFEAEEMELPQTANSAVKAAYRIAVVKVEEDVAGAGGQTHIKVGYPTTGAAGRAARPGAFEWKENVAGLFIVSQHHAGSFYAAASANPPIDATAEGYKDSLGQVRKAFAIVADPMKGLAVKEAKDRHLAAAVLIQKYRTAKAATAVRTEAVSAKESKLILDALLDADWDAQDKGVPAPYSTFMKMGLAEKDKWQPAAFNGAGTQAAHTKEEFRKWYEGDGAKYQLQKFVPK